MFGAEATTAARSYFHVRRDKTAERANIFVIYNEFIVGAVVAAFGAIVGFGLTIRIHNF